MLLLYYYYILIIFLLRNNYNVITLLFLGKKVTKKTKSIRNTLVCGGCFAALFAFVC